MEIKGPIDPGVDQFDAMFQQTETGIRWKLRGKLAQKLYAKENLSTTSWVALVCVLLAMPIMDILSTVDPSIPLASGLWRNVADVGLVAVYIGVRVWAWSIWGKE